MSDRIGGTFPDDRAARSPRAGSSDRPGARGTSYGSGSRSGAPSGAAPRGDRYGSDRGRSYDRGSDRPGGDRPSSGPPRGGEARGGEHRGGEYRGGDSRGSASRGDRPRSDRPASGSDAPRIPDSITDEQVSREVRDELGSLSFDRAGIVGRYLVAAELATDPEQAYRFSQAAKQLGARIGIVREVSGIMAYKSGRWAEALTELQAGRRLTGRNDYLPLMADAERGLGRLDRALDLVHSAEAKRLPRASQIELRIVESGIRRDQGMADASVLALQVPELTDGKQRPWSARLFYAYGEALLAASRPEAAREAFSRAVVADDEEETDALARLDELDGISVHDLEEDEDDDEALEELDDLEDDESDEDEDDDEDAFDTDDEIDDDADLAKDDEDEDEDDDDDDGLDDEADDDLGDEDDDKDEDDEDDEAEDEDDDLVADEKPAEESADEQPATAESSTDKATDKAEDKPSTAESSTDK
jgi:hypothetical protein